MPVEELMERSGIAPDMKTAIVAGGTAGNHAVTGIRAGEVLISVWHQDGTSGILVDLTSEFQGTGKGIIEDDVIGNSGGTDTSSDFLVVQWFAISPLLGI